ncbi:MAG TPA: hypothetical protein VFL04_00420, partial [Rectinemataceae bacterium]|nr:hypothetical protein [Rectinemataceae bacterium]
MAESPAPTPASPIRLSGLLHALLNAAGFVLYLAQDNLAGGGGLLGGGARLGPAAASLAALAILACFVALETLSRPRLLAWLTLACLGSGLAMASCLGLLVDVRWFGYAFILAFQYFTLFVRRYR